MRRELCRLVVGSADVALKQRLLSERVTADGDSWSRPLIASAPPGGRLRGSYCCSKDRCGSDETSGERRQFESLHGFLQAHYIGSVRHVAPRSTFLRSRSV